MFRPHLKISILSLLGLTAILYAPLAKAQTTTPAIFRDSNTVYQTNLPPGTNVEVDYNNRDVTKTIYSDACGVVKISLAYPFPSNLKVNGTAISPSSTSNSRTYQCLNGVAKYGGTMPAPTSNFQNENTSGTRITVYVVSSAITGGIKKPSLVTYTAKVTKTLKVNSCGILVVRGTPNAPLVDSSLLAIGNSIPKLFSSFPVGVPPICQNNSTYTATTNPATYNGASLFRTAKTIYQVGLTPNSLNVVEISGVGSKSYSQYRDRGVTCGVFLIKLPTAISSFKIGSTSYNIATVPSKLGTFDCPNNTGLDNFLPNTLYRYTPTILLYRVTDRSISRLNLEYPALITKNYPVNACGFVAIDSPNRANGFSATDTVKINGAAHTLSAIPLTTKPPLCRNGIQYASP
jgi:hypothetical protein